MKRTILIIGLLLIVSHILTEAHSILNALYHINNVAYDVFWSAKFKMLLSLQWIIKMNGDDLLVIIIFFIAAYIARKYSKRLTLILFVWALYHVVDIFLFWFNYKSDPYTYWNMIVFCTMETLMLFLPLREEKSKYKSLL